MYQMDLNERADLFFFLSTPTSHSKTINQVRKRGGDTISQECPCYQCLAVVKQARTILCS